MNTNINVSAMRKHEKGFSPSADERAQISKMVIIIRSQEAFSKLEIERLDYNIPQIKFAGHWWIVENGTFIDDFWKNKNDIVRIGMSLRTYKNGQRRVFLKYWI